MKIRVLVLIGFLCACFVSYGMDYNQPGRLAAQIFVSDSMDFIRKWGSGPQKSFYFPNSLKEVKTGTTLNIAILATGFEPSGVDAIDLEGDITITGPDGKEVLRRENYLSNHQSLKNEKTGVVLMQPVVGQSLSEQNTKGVYRIKVVVKDKVNGKSISTEYSLTLK